MLKRYQILLNDWLADYMKIAASFHDVSFSEMIRLNLCVEMGEMVSKFLPDYEFKYTTDDVYKFICRIADSDDPSEETHKFLSDLYFESRKALDHLKERLEAKDPALEPLLKISKQQGGLMNLDESPKA